MNGNITKDGIYKDLMWMHRIGIGGFHHFDAGLETPQIVEKRLEYMTPEWKDAFRMLFIWQTRWEWRWLWRVHPAGVLLADRG